MKDHLILPIKFDKWCDVLVFTLRHKDEDNKILFRYVRKSLDIDVGHVTKIVDFLIKYNYIIKTRKGRIVILEMTESGKVVATKLDELYKLLKLEVKNGIN